MDFSRLPCTLQTCQGFAFRACEPVSTTKPSSLSNAVGGSAICSVLKAFLSCSIRRRGDSRRPGEAKTRVNLFRTHLEEHCPEFADAVAEAMKLRPMTHQMPYLILELLRRNLSEPKADLERLLKGGEGCCSRLLVPVDDLPCVPLSDFKPFVEAHFLDAPNHETRKKPAQVNLGEALRLPNR